jgi:hypothetical protein
MLAFVSSFGTTSSTHTDGSKKRKADIRESFASQNVPKFVKCPEMDNYCATIMTVRWIAMEGMPLDTVENKHFHDMILAHGADAKKL